MGLLSVSIGSVVSGFNGVSEFEGFTSGKEVEGPIA